MPQKNPALPRHGGGFSKLLKYDPCYFNLAKRIKISMKQIEKAEEVLVNNPWISIAVALAVGFILGLSV